MKRKDYERPTMQVAKLQHTHMLMTSTQGSQASVQVYTWHNEVEESRSTKDHSVWEDEEEY